MSDAKPTFLGWFNTLHFKYKALAIAVGAGILIFGGYLFVDWLRGDGSAELLKQYQTEKVLLESENAKKDVEINSLKVSDAAKEAKVQNLEKQVVALEATIIESNRRLEQISNDVKKADTAYERAKLEKSVDATVESTCESLKKAGLRCE